MSYPNKLEVARQYPMTVLPNGMMVVDQPMMPIASPIVPKERFVSASHAKIAIPKRVLMDINGQPSATPAAKKLHTVNAEKKGTSPEGTSIPAEVQPNNICQKLPPLQMKLDSVEQALLKRDNVLAGAKENAPVQASPQAVGDVLPMKVRLDKLRYANNKELFSVLKKILDKFPSVVEPILNRVHSRSH